MKFLICFLSFYFLLNSYAETIDCTDAYGTTAKCERVLCIDKYKDFIGKWSGTFESYVQELSKENKSVFRPYHNTVTYSKEDCLRNIETDDTFIIGRKTDIYPEFQGLAQKESKGLLITGRRSDGSPFLRTYDDENGLSEYQLLYQNSSANLSIWQLTIQASSDGKSPEMRFTTIDGQDFLETNVHKRNVTVTMSIGPKDAPLWESIIVKGYHSLSK